MITYNCEVHVLTQSEIKSNLKYSESDGVFYWRNPRRGRKIYKPAGYKDSRGYLLIIINYKHYYAHRLAWVYVNAGDLSEIGIDHINGDRSDNRISNLRLVNQQENLKNKSLYKVNKSGVCGVRWVHDRNTWDVRIGVNGKQVRIGTFKCKLDAVSAIMKARIKYKYHVNHGRCD